MDAKYKIRVLWAMVFVLFIGNVATVWIYESYISETVAKVDGLMEDYIHAKSELAELRLKLETFNLKEQTTEAKEKVSHILQGKSYRELAKDIVTAIDSSLNK